MKKFSYSIVAVLMLCCLILSPVFAEDTTSTASVPEKIKIGLIQFAFIPGDVDGNLAQAEPLIKDAVDQGAQIILLPELWSLGYGIDQAPLSEPFETNKTLNFMKDQAKEYGVYISGGYAELGDDNKPYNSAALIDPSGEVILNHRKVMLYTPMGEDLIWTAGDTFEVVDTPLGRIGILICYDGDFPESWRIVAANKGADLILHPSAYETPCEVDGWWTKLYEASAMTNAVWIASANMAGRSLDGEKNFFGGSRIIDPTGNTVAETDYVTFDDEAVSHAFVVEIDYAQGLQNGNDWNGCLVGDRKMDVFYENGL